MFCYVSTPMLVLVLTRGAASETGKKISNSVPAPGLLSTLISPSPALTMACTTARPRPVPSRGFLLVKNGLDHVSRGSGIIPGAFALPGNPAEWAAPVNGGEVGGRNGHPAACA